jgi:imidazoleglycerol-phosphate dehydratase
MSKRTHRLSRKTTETRIAMNLNLDGSGQSQINTTIPFMDHMLALFAKHGRFDLRVNASGDTKVDDHHLVEDLGICLGQCLINAGASVKNIRRYGTASVPMDETLAHAHIDVSGRPYLVFNVMFTKGMKHAFDYCLIEDFFRGLVSHGKITLHLNLAYGRDNHHIAEAVFKAFAVACGSAVAIDKRITGAPSTKGRI